MTLRVAVPLFCLLVWAVILALTHPIMPGYEQEMSGGSVEVPLTDSVETALAVA